MAEDRSVGRMTKLFLLIMLLMGTLLHGYSVAHVYLPAVVKALSLLGIVSR